MESTYGALAERIVNASKRRQENRTSSESTPGSQRILIALAGPPGSGKTTIATNVVRALAELADQPKTVAISVDGFHLPLAVLHKLPNATEALARRGAPWTFDAKAALEMVKELKASAGIKLVSVPTFDHTIKDPVANGLIVDRDVEVCLLEGNYLLSDEGEWSEIADIVDERWLVTVDGSQARRRVASRHLAAGIEPTMELALARADYNDIPNGQDVMKQSLGRHDVLIESIEMK